MLAVAGKPKQSPRLRPQLLPIIPAPEAAISGVNIFSIQRTIIVNGALFILLGVEGRDYVLWEVI